MTSFDLTNFSGFAWTWIRNTSYCRSWIKYQISIRKGSTDPQDTQYCIVLISVMFQRGIWQRNGTRTLLRWTASRWHFSQFRYSWKYHWSVSNMLLQFSYQLLRNDLSTYSKRVSESWNCQRTLQSLWQWNAGFKSWRRWSLQWTPKYV